MASELKGLASGPSPAISEGSGEGDRVPDEELLRRFAEGPGPEAEAAFAALLSRHGAMVLRVCRQILGDCEDARDAFQATFLVLVQKQGALRRRESLASWLHGVARRAALEFRTDAARRRSRERRGAELAAATASGGAAGPWPELHEEIAGLPEKFREAVVLCYVEGASTDMAARLLGCPRGTVLSRLARARDRLRRRLSRRGLAPPAVLAALAPAGPSTPAVVPEVLREATLRAVLAFGAGRGGVPAATLAPAQAVLKALFLARVKLAATVVAGVVVVAGAAVGTAWALQRRAGAPPPVAEVAPMPVAAGEGVGRPGIVEAPQRVANLKAIGLAMANAGRDRLPASAITGEGGKPLLSWRVALLPHLGCEELYRRFRRDEPWDSPHNKALIPLMPPVYAPVGLGTPPEGSTHHRVFVGPGAAFEGTAGVARSEFGDGLPDTILVVEAGEAVPWTRPGDLPFAADRPLAPGIGPVPGAFFALFGDGEVRSVRRDIPERTLHAAITRAGGEPVRAADVGDAAR